MVRLDKLPIEEREHLLSRPCPSFETSPWVAPPPLSRCRIALISTAGLYRRGDRPFVPRETGYRIIPSDTPAGELVMGHISANFDRTGFQQDWNVVFPLDRLGELEEQNVIGALADYHYSFMGAVDPALLEETARNLARIMKKGGVNAVFLTPV